MALMSVPGRPRVAESTAITVILAISASHFLNDLMQSLLPALYPMLRDSYSLSFSQVGFLTLAFQISSSLLQPLVGLYADKRPLPFSMAIGMGATLIGLILLGTASSYPFLVMAAMLVGVGSSIFHPEASRVARMAAGGRPGFAQSLFQVGGNFGSSFGPLLAAFIVLPRGQGSITWFTLVAMLAIYILWRVGKWYQGYQLRTRSHPAPVRPPIPIRKLVMTMGVLVILVISKNAYTVSISSYYTFYLIERFGVEVKTSQLLLFLYLASAAVGTFLGGPLGDKYGRKFVIWGSILGALPFTLYLPYAPNLTVTAVLSVLIGIIISSAFPAILVFAQELIPGKVGTVAGAFFGFAFGIAGVAAAALGNIADSQGIFFVYKMCSYLPLAGLLTVFLPGPKELLIEE